MSRPRSAAQAATLARIDRTGRRYTGPMVRTGGENAESRWARLCGHAGYVSNDDC